MTEELTDDWRATWRETRFEQGRSELARPEYPPYATIIPGRVPVVKMHKTIGYSKAAVSSRSTGRYDASKGGYACDAAELYEWQGDRWVLLYTVASGTFPNDLPWK